MAPEKGAEVLGRSNETPEELEAGPDVPLKAPQQNPGISSDHIRGEAHVVQILHLWPQLQLNPGEEDSG